MGGKDLIAITHGSWLIGEFNKFRPEYSSSFNDLYSYYLDNEKSLEIIFTNNQETKIFDFQLKQFIDTKWLPEPFYVSRYEADPYVVYGVYYFQCDFIITYVGDLIDQLKNKYYTYFPLAKNFKLIEKKRGGDRMK
ncbi:hypothetical protein [Spiroplasma sp. SV19]|uniref:hypothetical protein n=1 Tax=Spiroplasma sp. SV19 TaxID=2570468 RepID=UPI0024B65819|nr:hypothetical protein [Spiroplasma sp. SV19]WHQ37535.1 hypothetical protein E7Y35_06805 [Spiroplasma sp. SV19]